MSEIRPWLENQTTVLVVIRFVISQSNHKPRRSQTVLSPITMAVSVPCDIRVSANSEHGKWVFGLIFHGFGLFAPFQPEKHGGYTQNRPGWVNWGGLSTMAEISFWPGLGRNSMTLRSLGPGPGIWRGSYLEIGAMLDLCLIALVVSLTPLYLSVFLHLNQQAHMHVHHHNLVRR